MRRAGAEAGVRHDRGVRRERSRAAPQPRRPDARPRHVVKMDFGALVGGYHADMTRTVAFGEPACRLREVYEVVRLSQQAGVDAVRAGVTGGEVDEAARAVIRDAGYGEAFEHASATASDWRSTRDRRFGPRGDPCPSGGNRRDGGTRDLPRTASAACGSRTWSRSPRDGCP